MRRAPDDGDAAVSQHFPEVEVLAHLVGLQRMHLAPDGRPANRFVPAAFSFRALDPSSTKRRPRSSIARWTSFRSEGSRWISSTITQESRLWRRSSSAESARVAQIGLEDAFVQQIDTGRIGKLPPGPCALAHAAESRRGRNWQTEDADSSDSLVTPCRHIYRNTDDMATCWLHQAT